jgi:hypothetical protein
MGALAEEVEVEIREDLAKLVGIDDVAGDGAFADAEAVRKVLRPSLEGHRRLEQPVGPPPLHPEHPIVGDQLHIGCSGLQRPDENGGVAVDDDAMPAKNGKRVVARPGNDGVEGLGVSRSRTKSHVLMISF